MKMQIKVKKLHEAARLPTYATDGSGCFDIYYSPEYIYKGEVWKITKDYRSNSWGTDVEFQARHTFETGLAFEIPEGYVMLVFSRSGHGFNHGTRLSNCVGVIDSDYRGELKISLTVDGKDSLDIAEGDRVAQAMVIPTPKVSFVEAGKLSTTVRGTGGFGSTGN